MANQRVKINPDLREATPLKANSSSSSVGGAFNNNNNNKSTMVGGFYADVNSPIASTPNLKHLRGKKNTTTAALPPVPVSTSTTPVSTTNAAYSLGGAGSSAAPAGGGVEEMEGWTSTLFSPVLKLFGGVGGGGGATSHNTSNISHNTSTTTTTTTTSISHHRDHYNNTHSLDREGGGDVDDDDDDDANLETKEVTSEETRRDDDMYHQSHQNSSLLHHPDARRWGRERGGGEVDDSRDATEEMEEHRGEDEDEGMMEDHDHDGAISTPHQGDRVSTHQPPAFLMEFDPYLFMSQLPPYEAVLTDIVLDRRPRLPKKTCTMPVLVLDLDETLVHCSAEPTDVYDVTFTVQFNGAACQVYVRKRPGLDHFLEQVSRHFEIAVFTASQKVYAERLLDILDPSGTLIKHRLYRESCLLVAGNLLKDLHVLDRDLRRTIIVDNSPHAFGYHLDNGIPIESWFDDPDDTELMKLLPFLLRLAREEDVRPTIRNYFKLHELVREKGAIFSSMQQQQQQQQLEGEDEGQYVIENAGET